MRKLKPMAVGIHLVTMLGCFALFILRGVHSFAPDVVIVNREVTSHISNFALSYYNPTSGESYHFNETSFFPAGELWRLPLHMYYYEQESLGTYDPPPEDPTFVYTVAGLTLDECHAMGLNESMVHEDFMIGSADMNIDAVCRDGKTVPIFRNGNWAF